jgi:hypothetical protein
LAFVLYIPIYQEKNTNYAQTKVLVMGLHGIEALPRVAAMGKPFLCGGREVAPRNTE